MTHLEQIILAWLDINIMAAAVPVDPLRGLEGPGPVVLLVVLNHEVVHALEVLQPAPANTYSRVRLCIS